MSSSAGHELACIQSVTSVECELSVSSLRFLKTLIFAQAWARHSYMDWRCSASIETLLAMWTPLWTDLRDGTFENYYYAIPSILTRMNCWYVTQSYLITTIID